MATDHNGVDDVRHRIARLAGLPLLLLLDLLLPGSGRRRRRRPPATPLIAPLCLADANANANAHRTGTPALRGEDNALVRPYLLAHERREDAQRQRVRRQQAPRRPLRFAVHGIDLGPCVIHGVEVAR